MSKGGQIRHSAKSDLLHCLETVIPDSTTKTPSEVDANVVDAAGVVQMLNHSTSRTFRKYAETLLMPFVSNELKKTDYSNRSCVGHLSSRQFKRLY